VRALEAQLGYPLFVRKTRALELTRMGQLYLPGVSRAFADLANTTTGVFGKSGPTLIRLRCLQSFALLWLVPRLPALYAQMPELQLQINTGSWSGAMDAEQLDLDIRYGDGRWTDGTVEPLIKPDIIPLCAPSLMEGSMSAQTLARGPLIDISGVADTWDSFFAAQGVDHAPPPILQVDQSITALDLATQGMGYCLVSEIFAKPYLADGRLVPALEARPHSDQGLFLVFTDHTGPAQAENQALRRWLCDEIAKS
jgi:LysR family glycine cleavage system transcriptional activator